MAKDYDCFDSDSDLINFEGFTKFFQVNLIELSKLFEIRAMKKTMTASVVNLTSREKRDYEEGTYDIADKVTHLPVRVLYISPPLLTVSPSPVFSLPLSLFLYQQ